MNGGARAPSAAAETPAANAIVKKPRIALALATSLGLGCIPAAPGTFGSIAGVLVALIPFQTVKALGIVGTQTFIVNGFPVDPLLVVQCVGAIVIALIGVLVSSRAARYWRQKDPQRVVIDEVSGQHLALFLGSILPVWWALPAKSWAPRGLGFITYQWPLSWQYLLLGFILFRVFDIWKPFPARQAESLRGGWGIMADDWVAGVYAALLLWVARGFGL